MWFNITAIALAVLSVAGIIYIIIRHLTQLAGIDASQLPGERPARLKQTLLQRRLERQLVSLSKPVVDTLQNVGRGVYQRAHGWAERIIQLEETYRRRLLGRPLADVLARQQQKQLLLNEAEVLMEQEKYDEAERVYVQLLTLDPASIEAFEGLGTLYYRTRDYDEARQTFEHLIKLHGGGEAGYSGLAQVAAERGDLRTAVGAYEKTLQLNPKAAVVHYNLAKVHEAMEERAKALGQIQAALALEGENPRYLDYAITLAILQRDTRLATVWLNQLAATNPDNQKLAQYRQAITDLAAEA